jgi:hypothetical protein
MADFTKLINELVAVANDITTSLQAQILHQAFKNYSRDGQPVWSPIVVKRAAIVEKRQDQVRALDGTQKVSHTRLTFLVPVSIDPRDKLTLPDGSAPAILAVKAPLGSDGKAFVTEVWF